jgi:hypothetical protein
MLLVPQKFLGSRHVTIVAFYRPIAPLPLLTLLPLVGLAFLNTVILIQGNDDTELHRDDKQQGD